MPRLLALLASEPAAAAVFLREASTVPVAALAPWGSQLVSVLAERGAAAAGTPDVHFTLELASLARTYFQNKSRAPSFGVGVTNRLFFRISGTAVRRARADAPATRDATALCVVVDFLKF